MTAALDLLDQILATADRQGLKGYELAERAGIAPASLSRMKRTGRLDLDSLVRLAGAVGLQLSLQPADSVTSRIQERGLF